MVGRMEERCGGMRKKKGIKESKETDVGNTIRKPNNPYANSE